MKKVTAYFLVLVFLIANISVTAKADTSGTNIINAPTASLQQMQQWARDNNATETFISLAEIYWNEASKHGNVNPIAAYAQSAKETAFGRFGGVLDESYHNPCGLKTAVGGDNYDPNAHQVFATWQDGIDAHLDHLALYAGANGYPRSNTLDPRHKAYLLGTAKTVEDLGGKWAGSLTYGTEVVSYMQSIQQTTIKIKLPNRNNIDSPSNNQTYINSDVNLSGWALSGDGIKQIKVLINNTYIGDAQLNLTRTDVAKAYPDYKQSNSGFQLTIDKSKLNDGANKVEIQAETYSGEKIIDYRIINFDSLQPKMNIDIDTSKNYSKDEELSIRGWALINGGVKSVDVFLNGENMGTAQYGYERQDVNRVYPNFNNVNSEFRATINRTKLKLGQNNLVIKVTGNNGTVITQNRTVNVKKYDYKGNLDSPNTVESYKDVIIAGWGINGSGISSAKVYLDGKYLGDSKIESRPDIAKVFPDYADNQNSGYSYTINKSLISHGKHAVSIQLNFKNGDTYNIQRNFVYQVVEPKIQIDEPRVDSLENSQSIDIKGWSLNYSGISSVNILVNNKLIGNAQTGISRTDVYNAYPQYKDANSGFSYTIDSKYLVEGVNVIQVQAIGNDGIVSSFQKQVKFAPLGFAGSLDGPNPRVQDSDVAIYGWALDGYGIKDAKVYVDGNFISNATFGVTRNDVKKYYPNYTNSDKAGFIYTISKGSLAYGYHDIKVNVTTNSGKVYTFTKKIYYYKYENLITIDTPKNGSKYRLSEKLNVTGWTLNYSGINTVKLSIDGNFVSNANYGVSRQDVANAYPLYANSNSGFSQSLDISKLSRGYHTLEVKAIGKDGAEVSQVTGFYANDYNTMANIDEPNSAIYGNNVKVIGWALSYYGVKDVKIKANGVDIGSAIYGVSRPDLAQAYADYPNSANGGFELSIDSSKLKMGGNTIEATIYFNDGSNAVVTKNFNVDNVMAGSIDSPTSGDILRTGSKVSGWAIFGEGTKQANVYVDGTLMGQATLNVSRQDVQKAFPQYNNAYNSGFEYVLDLNKLKAGTHKLTIELISNLNRALYLDRDFKTNAKLVVVDAGHNYGGDYGAESKFNGKTYSETELNMQVAVKLQKDLQDMGYNVVMTRQPWDKFTDPKDVSLQKRTQLANDLKADLFVSIHHDKSSYFDSKGNEIYNLNAGGVSTHYSSYRPSLDNDGIISGTDPGGWSYDDLKIDTTPTIQAQLSKQLANNVVNAIGSKLAYSNLNAHDHGLYVTRNINCPSILIENGYLSNPTEVLKCSDPNEQEKKAKVIADEIGKLF